MARQISHAKYHLIKQHLRESFGDKAYARKAALAVCARDPFGTSIWDGRGQAISNYLGARRWVQHYRSLLDTSEPIKMANGHSIKVRA